MAVQEWNATDYAREGRFVANLAGDVVGMLAPQRGERILDLGCGDGALTKRLAESGASVMGVDGSAAMAEAARALGVDAYEVKAEALTFDGEFDAVFSNAALHWVRDQEGMMRCVYRALKPGGRFVAEFGGLGNIAAVRTALRAALEAAGRADLLDAEGAENYFPSPAAYQARLEARGFSVKEIRLVPRPTALGANGIRGWYGTFRTGVLQALTDAEREQVLSTAERLLEPALRDEQGNWFADYVRLRFVAVRN